MKGLFARISREISVMSKGVGIFQKCTIDIFLVDG